MAVGQPKVRPLERFWPYADLPEQLTDEELASLHPDLSEVLRGGPPDQKFSVTLVFPDLNVPNFSRALDIARTSSEFREIGTGPMRRYRARFLSTGAARMLDVYDVVGASRECEVLIDGQAVPYARELWLPLVRFFVNR